MKRRQFLPVLLGSGTAAIALGILKSPAHATILNDLFDSATGSPSSPATAPAAAAPVYAQGDSMFAEIYGEHYISREQYQRLQSGSATHWYDVAPKPYARMHSTNGLEHYYFPFDFGSGGVIIVSDTTGAIASWDISTGDLVPAFNPPERSPVIEVAATPTTPTAPAQPTGYPPIPPAQPPYGCY